MCVSEAIAGLDEGEALTGPDDHDLSRQPARQRIEVTSALPEPTKLNAAGSARSSLWSCGDWTGFYLVQQQANAKAQTEMCETRL